MILFDGSTNYELGDLSVHERVNKPVSIHLGLYKNTNVTERVGIMDDCSVVRYGRDYLTPGLHDMIMELDIKSVGHFIIHAMDPQGRRRLDSLKEIAVKHHRAELWLTVQLTGDNVTSEPQMAPFELKLRAQPGNWSAFPFMRSPEQLR